ncbi:hypothetical protein [Hyphomicrobium sp.]|uniref:hypothetical protein n=1 Tax=Hyphomicrobium sp. TaxID=82 RepID=UPI002D778393|nr:hypothetical protein [Hyphomicrobium sp.]HET6387880.1 hypothetical protein [Hyphomicrobium sp.]
MKTFGHSLRASLHILTAFGALAAIAAPALGDEPAKPEWPCVYRKVPVLSAATIWDGPEIKDTSSWRKDETIRKLSQYLISRRVTEEEADAAIKKFAEGVPPDARDAKLTELFAAVLTRTNEDRRLVMSGIERFHKRQLERAKEIEKEGIELPPLDENGAPAQDTHAPAGEISELSSKEEKYKWEVRAFQEKQANIPIACEIPQLIDERAGALARAIRAEMKS